MRRISRFFQVTALWILLLPQVVTFVGAASNQLVLIANHDKFPVMANTVKAHEFSPDAVVMPDGTVMLDDTHCLMTSKTHLNVLADIFDFHNETDSIGDLLLHLGEWLSGFCLYVWIEIVIFKLKAMNK